MWMKLLVEDCWSSFCIVFAMFMYVRMISLWFSLVMYPRRACARVTVLVLCVCVCVCVCVYPSVCLFQVQLLQRTFTPAINDSRGFLVGFSWILIRGFSKKTSLQKLWREKANMLMS